MYTPALANMKLAEFRYGKEEMLALFSPELDPPKELLSLGALYVDSCQFPLNLTQVSLKKIHNLFLNIISFFAEYGFIVLNYGKILYTYIIFYQEDMSYFTDTLIIDLPFPALLTYDECNYELFFVNI